MRWFGKDEPESLPFTAKDFTDIGNKNRARRKGLGDLNSLQDNLEKGIAYGEYINKIEGVNHNPKTIHYLYNNYGKFMTPGERKSADQAIAKSGFDIDNVNQHIDIDILKNAKETRDAYYKKVNGLRENNAKVGGRLSDKIAFLSEEINHDSLEFLDLHEQELAEHNKAIQEAKDKDEKKRLKQIKNDWIKSQKDNYSIPGTRQELLAMHDEAVKAAQDEFNSQLKGLNKEARKTKANELLDSSQKAKDEYWENLVNKHINQRLKKAGISDENMSTARNYIKVATTEREIERLTKAQQSIDARIRNLKTEEGVREFVSRYRKEQGLPESGGGPERTSKLSKFGKAGKFAAGVAVATGLLALASVGTARMMMAGGAQPNSNLYNPYQASY